jgi:two-component system sensor histidine kinase CpxA
MLRMIYNLENLDGKALARTVESVAEKHDIQVYLIAPDGADLLGREPPGRATRMVRQLQRDPRRPFITSPRDQLAAYRIKRPEAGPMAAVFVFPEKRAVILDTLSDSLWLRVGLAVLISGLVCFGLSRLITNRIRDLQVASRRLAEGDLDTRLQVRERGGDETDELARDFNTMAGQLQERIKAQKRLLGDVSHELRSPLARLRLALALAQEKPGQRDEYMQRIEQEAERLEELIEQLLSSQSKEVMLDTTVDLSPLLAEVCADTSFEGQAAGKRCSFATDRQQAPVLSHSDLLRKGFENILRNALHHTADNSNVEVGLQLLDDMYEVSITDYGPGVPEADLAKIFNEFYRSDTARTRESGGFGLGLAIARRAILQHGGTISAENTGSGLRIIVHLPAQSPPPTAQDPAADRGTR